MSNGAVADDISWDVAVLEKPAGAKTSSSKAIEPVVGVQLVSADHIEPTEIQWLWCGWIARRKFQILAGAAGTGKTTICMALAGIVSAGGAWPDGSKCEPGTVLIWSGEDGLDDTIVPRLIAAGADRKNIFLVTGVREAGKNRGFDPAQDLPSLIEKIEDLGKVDLIIIEPMVNAVTGDSNKASDVRRGLQPLVEMAEKLDAAVLGVTHFTKNSVGRDPLERVIGSQAFGALARLVHVTGKGQGDERIFVRAKSNIGEDDGGFSYRIDVSTVTPTAAFITWLGPLDGDATTLLTTAGKVENPSQLADAKTWLEEILEGGPVASAEVAKQALARGFASRTMARAKDELSVRSIKRGQAWWMALPSENKECQARQENG